MSESSGRGRKSSERSRAGSRTHDPETILGRGMSTEGAEVDEAETMASTGNADASFQQIASGSATGLGLDRDEKIGTGGLAAGEDSDDVEAGDWWRMNLRDGAEAAADREIPASRERMPGEESEED